MHEYEQTLRFGGGGETLLSTIGIVFLIVGVLLICVVPRKHLILPLLFTIFCTPLDQQLVVGGLHLTIFRILILFAWLRVLAGHWTKDYSPSPIDRAMILWAIASTFTFICLWGEWGAVVNRLGFLYNAFGVYFLFRILVRDLDDADRAVRVFAIICGVLAALMLNERVTGHNVFSIFGGVPELSAIREGNLRAQGPFAHPILAGTFGAILLPLFLGLWWRHKYRKTAVLGIISAVVMVVVSASSTPIMATLAGVGALFFWPFRKWMRAFRWGVLAMLVALHLVMKAPVWALIGRIDVMGGSSYHRYELINQFILHFSEWWLTGTRYTSSWGFYMHDLSNQFVTEGVEGGLITFCLFLWIIVCCFQALGRARKSRFSDLSSRKGVWALGATLTACLAAFIGTSFFDQTIVAWYALLAMIAGSALPRRVAMPMPSPQAKTRRWENLEIDEVESDGVLASPRLSLLT